MQPISQSSMAYYLNKDISPPMSSAQEQPTPDRQPSASDTNESPQPQEQQRSQSTTSYFTYPVSHVVSGLYRRLTEPVPEPSLPRPPHDPMSNSDVFTPPRTASPFQPPPLTPLTLKSSPNTSHQLLTRSLAEEIRLLVPPRLQLLDTWQLAYSLDRDGSSLSTLYEKCRTYSHRSQRSGYVLVVKDASSSAGQPGGGGNGAIFGAYLSDPLHPSTHYYGTGECFLWRASILPGTPIVQVNSNGKAVFDDGRDNGSKEGLHPQDAAKFGGLPLPPSADTEQQGRNTTFRGEEQAKNSYKTGGTESEKIRESSDTLTGRETLPRAPLPGERSKSQNVSPVSSSAGVPITDLKLKAGDSRSGTSTPERIRFKAFPYSGVNDYMIFCETGFLSVGGGLVQAPVYFVPFLPFVLFSPENPAYCAMSNAPLAVMAATAYGLTIPLRKESAVHVRHSGTNR